ncbi:MAG TPA: hypothetical protein VKA44_05410, partial [Gemmatimonadota bacterium]|nr:hypothetical protein [Gemmatimonadota bacterium]
GRHFGVDAPSNVVRVDGRAVHVALQPDSSLRIELPDDPCWPARDAAITLTTPAGADSTAAPLKPRQDALALAPGQQAVVRTPDSELCLQLAPSSADERYLVGVQARGADVPGVLSADLVVRTPGDTAAPASLPPVSLARRALGGAKLLSRDRGLSRRERGRALEARLRRWEREHLQALPPAPGATRVRSSTSLSADYVPGDEVDLRVPDLSPGADPCADYTEITGAVWAVADSLYVIGDVNDPVGFTQADWDALAAELHDQVEPALFGYFGRPAYGFYYTHTAVHPGWGDRIAVVVTREVNRVDPGLAGFAFAGDLYDRGTCASSDEADVVYLKAPDPGGELGPAYSRDRAVAQTPRVAAHELTHVVQLSRRRNAGSPFMSAVVAEAQATLGEEIAGDAVTGRSTGQDYGYDVAFDSSGTNGTAWYADRFTDLFHYFGMADASTRVEGAPERCGWWGADPSPCVGRPLWYGVGWSFLRWVADRYGPAHAGGEAGLARDLIDDPGTGLSKVADQAGAPLDDLLAGWAASLYVDDRLPSGADASLTLPSWDLYGIQQGGPSTARLSPPLEPYAGWHAALDVKVSSADYVLVGGGPRPATSLAVYTDGAGDRPGTLQLWVVRVQ